MPTPVERAPPVATTNKTPIYEYYGFVMYLTSFVVFGKLRKEMKNRIMVFFSDFSALYIYIMNF